MTIQFNNEMAQKNLMVGNATVKQISAKMQREAEKMRLGLLLL
jgi:hypothetical protein